MIYKQLNTQIYSREDLQDQGKRIEDITIQDFERISNIYSGDLYIFVDNDFRTKVLKSRFTETGLIRHIPHNILPIYTRKKKRFFGLFK